MKKPAVGVGVIILKGDSVLLIQRGNPPEKGSWSLPGGKQEFGETVPHAAVREILEETGLEIKQDDLSFLGVADLINLPHYHYTLVNLWTDVYSGEPVAGSDAQDIKWVVLDQLDGMSLWSETEKVILKAAVLRDLSLS